MGTFLTAQICLNGHCITDALESFPESSESFCSKCGTQTITNCPTCNTAIRGAYQELGFASWAKYTVPAYCYNCGKPFPWTRTALETMSEMIQEDSEIDPELQKSLTDALPDLVSETPKTNLAIIRLKRGLLAVGKFTAEGLRQFVIDFGCELVKRQMNF